MNEEGIFSARYEKSLELVEKISPKLVEKIEDFVSSLPGSLKRNISKEKTCELEGTEVIIDLQMHDNMMEIRHLNLISNIDTYAYIYPFYISELEECGDKNKNEDEHDMLLASITYTNTKGDVSLELYYEETSEGINFKGMHIPKNAREFDYSVYLDKVDDEFVLTYIASFNDVDLKVIKQKISYEELIEYSCDAVENYDEECDDSLDYDN